jgi:hypothetical protein
MAYLIFILLVLCEVTWDWYHIKRLGRSPNYSGSNMLRVIFGTVFWFCVPVMHSSITIEQWWFVPAPMFFWFWFLFDWWLNVSRGSGFPYWYLGSNSKIDRWQKDHGGAFKWFWIKLGLAITSLAILIWFNEILLTIDKIVKLF